jgi:TonB-linked SusC/RagA family outer membrane protein
MNRKIKTMPGGTRWLSRQQKVIMKCMLFLLLLMAGTHPAPAKAAEGAANEAGVQQQRKTVSGTVVDAYSEAVIGANIIEKGTSNGTVSDADGKFTLNVSDNAILQISYIGYISQEINVLSIDGNSLTVTLSEGSLDLGEVIVVGYGTMRKSDLTGTVVRANLNAFAESPNTNILQALQGSVAGLNVGIATNAGDDPGFSIRGRNTISGSTAPLIVLDGIIFRGNMSDINPHDIQSVDVLKDASATAIYGSQASNGVLILTSKSGQEEKPIVSYTGTAAWQSPTNSDYMPANRQGYLDRAAATAIDESRMGPDYLQPNPSWNPLSKLDASIHNGYTDGTDTDWWGLMVKDYSFMYDHNLGVRGKNKNSGYYFSLGYTDQQNIMVNDRFNRYSIRVNLDSNITDWMKVGIQSFASVTNRPGYIPVNNDTDRAARMNQVYSLPPLAAAFDENNEPIVDVFKGTINPVLWKDIQQDDNRLNLFANIFADISIPFIQGLSYRLNFGQNVNNRRRYIFNPYASSYQGQGSKEHRFLYEWTADNILTYKRQFGLHDLNATLVYGVEKRQFDHTKAEAEIFANDVLGYHYLDAGQTDRQRAYTNGWEESSIYTMFRLFYNYNHRYMFTGTIRRDGFSGFGENNKFAVFPSVAGAWVASEESFVKDNVSWIDNLKVRLSYGSNGNRAVSRYQTLAHISADRNYLYGDGADPEVAQYVNTFANKDLKWEKTVTFNFGLDFSVLNSRLTGAIELYSGKTNDMLYEISIPRVNGLSSAWTNIGELSNHGQEFSLTGIPVKDKDFEWSLTFNFSRNRNKVISILGRDDNQDGKEDDLISSNRGNSIIIGEPYGIWYDYNTIGMWQIDDQRPTGVQFGTYKIESAGEIPTSNDRKLIGYKDPSYRFSILNSFRYKGLELRVFINSIQGGDNYYIENSRAGMPNPDNMYSNNFPVWDWWMPERPNAKYRRPGATVAGLGSPESYEYHPYTSRSFVRLQDVTLSYTFTPKILEKVGLRMLKVYASGKNLATWTKWDSFDPETGGSIFSGIFPVMKSYSAGLNVEF